MTTFRRVKVMLDTTITREGLAYVTGGDLDVDIDDDMLVIRDRTNKNNEGEGETIAQFKEWVGWMYE